VGAVQALAAEQRADGTGFGDGVGLLDDPALVLGGEAPAKRALPDLGVWHRHRLAHQGAG
jgi:hypothetical protein